MQIREVTLPSEYLGNLAKKAGSGIARTAKGVAKGVAGTTVAKDLAGAVSEPFQKLGTLLDTPGAMFDPKIAATALDQRERAMAYQDIEQRAQAKQARIAQQTQQRAKELAQEWQKQHQQQQQQGTQQPTVMQEAPIDLKQRTAAARAQRAQARQASTASTASPVANDTTGFVAWSDSQLRDVIPGTRTEITMDKIRKDSALYGPVKTALDRVLKDPSNTAAVQDYFEAAMSAMQQYSARAKQATYQSAGAGGGASSGSGILNKFLSPSQIQELQQVIQRDPSSWALIKKELRVR